LACGLIITFLFHFGFFSELENRTIDFRFRQRGKQPGCGDIVIVGITDACIKKIGTWPWPRLTHAKLLSILKKEGAKVVAFDLMFHEPSILGTGDDEIFSKAASDSGNVVFPIVVSKRMVLDSEMEMSEKEVAERPLPILQLPIADEGFIDVEHHDMNTDGVIRHLFLERKVDNSPIYFFGLVAAARFLGLPIKSTDSGISIGNIKLPYYTRRERTKNTAISSFMLNYVGRSSQFEEIFEEIPYYTVLCGSYTPGLFKDKAVIVGTKATGISEDLKFSPFGGLPGMEIHANLIHNILTRRFLTRLSPSTVDLILLILGFSLAWVLFKFHNVHGNFFSVALFLSWFLLSWISFSFDVVIELMPVSIMFPTQWAATRLIQQFCALREKNRELAKKVRELSMINEVSQTVIFMGDLAKTLQQILSRAVQSLGAESGFILMLDERYETLVDTAVVFGIPGDLNMRTDVIDKYKTGEGIAGEVFLNGSSRLISDVTGETNLLSIIERDIRVSSLVCVPLKIRDTAIGVMNVVNKTSGRFDQEDLQLADTMANQAAVIIENARLFNLATIDGLTGLIVHMHFQSKIEEEFRRAKRYEKPLSIIMTDIDYFKKFNDTWGHQTGDMVLREVAKCVRSTMRDTDIAARYGGEEFAVILPETDVEGAKLFAERLRQNVENTIFSGPKGDLRVAISLGLSSLPINPANTALEMIKLADDALYEAKHAGRNCVRVAADQALQTNIS